jgi:negative regulator of replication initiation
LDRAVDCCAFVLAETATDAASAATNENLLNESAAKMRHLLKAGRASDRFQSPPRAMERLLAKRVTNVIWRTQQSARIGQLVRAQCIGGARAIVE